jgi:trafficking protein particle complex subunit 9
MDTLNYVYRSTIRITVENVSTIPIEFIKVTCVDSTMAPAQQALAEGEMPVFETYETEYELLRRPVFRWDPEVEPKTVGPGEKAMLTIIGSGKVGWYVTSLLRSERCLGDKI